MIGKIKPKILLFRINKSIIIKAAKLYVGTIEILVYTDGVLC